MAARGDDSDANAAIAYKYGVTGFVELHRNIVKKYSEFDQLYWLKEYTILLYLWPYRTDNIIKYQSGSVVYKKDVISKTYKTYHESVLERFPATLHERKLYRDAEIIQFLLDITSALAFLHSKNILHRDIKPSNIALTEDNRVVLIDFSHSHLIDIPLAKLDPQVVTYWYRAPEVFKYQENGEKAYDASIDIWALGAVMIELLTGKNFADHYTTLMPDHDTAEQLYGAMLQNHKTSFNQMRDYYFFKKRLFIYAAQYWVWISKMVAPEPERRSSAAELYEEVRTFARLHKIAFIEPVNGGLVVQMPELEKQISLATEEETVLFNACVEYLKRIRVEHHMLFNIGRIAEVIQFLIGKKDIIKENYLTICAALAIIVDVVLFDNLSEIKDYGILNNQSVKNMMVFLLNKYDQHLFGHKKIFSYAAV